jgi:hypothetical protein|tara:strand:+ start:210 stop:488 length:279 start_codon:yes stop_codon:yes gene_type:complete
MTKARDLADIVSNLSSNAGKAVVVNDGGTELVFGTAGGEVNNTTDAYKNYSTVSANATLNLASGKNYFLAGIITINDNITWTISGSGTLTII